MSGRTLDTSLIEVLNQLSEIERELSSLLGGRKVHLITPKFLNQRIRDRVLASAEVQYDKG